MKTQSTTRESTEESESSPSFNSIFLEMSQDIMWLVDSGHCLIWGNNVFHKRITEFFGNDFKIGDNVIHKSLPAMEAEKWKNYYQRAFAGERFTIDSTWMVGQNELTSTFSFKKVKKPVDQSDCIAVIGKDITLHLKKEKALIADEKKYKAFVEQSRHAMFLHDLKGNIVEVNKATSTLTGYSRKELLQMTVFDIDPDAGIREDKIKIWESIPSDRETTIEVKHKRRDGTIYPAEVNISKIKFNKSDYILALARDITEKKAAEQKLHETVSFNAQLIEMMQDGFSVIDENGVHIMVNEALCNMIGYSKEELIGHGVPHKYWDKDSESISAAALADLKAGKLSHYELFFRHKNGRKIPVIVSPSVIQIEDGKKNHFAATVKDITKRKNYENILALRLKLADMKDRMSLNAFLTAALDTLELITESKIGFFHFVEDNGHDIRLQAWSSNTKAHFCKAVGEGLHYTIGQAGVWADCIRLKKPVIHNDFKTVKNKKGYPEGHAEVLRELTIPVVRNNRVVAVTGIGNKPTDYDDNDLKNAQVLADLIWELAETIITREKLVESEKQFRNLVENAPYGIYRTTPDGEILLANPFLLRMLEFDSLEEIKTRNLQQQGFVNQSARDQFLEKMNTDGEVHNFESELVTRSGKPISVIETSRVVRSKNGKLLYFEGMMEDVSELNRLTKSLQKSERETKALLELIPDLIFRINSRGEILDFSGTKSELYFQKADIIGKTTSEVLPGDIANLVNKKIALTLSSNEIQTFEYQLPIVDTGLQDYEARMVVFDYDEVIAIVRNVTESRKARQTILDNLANLRAIMESTDDVMILLEADGTIVESNEEHANRLGFTRDEIIGKNVFDLLQGKIRDSRKALIQQAIETGKPINTVDVRAGITNEIRIFPIAGNDTMSSRVAVFARNVTEQIKIQEALAKSEERYRTLFENLSQGVFFQAASGKVIEANQAALNLFGLTRNQFLGIDSYDKRWKVVNEFYEPIPSESHTSMKALLSGKPVENDIVGVWIPDHNKYNWMIVNAIPQFRPGEQKPYQVFVTLQDINDRMHFEASLRLSEERFALVIDASELGIWDWNLETGETYFSPQMKNQLGYRDDEIENNFDSWMDLLHPEEKERNFKAVEEYLKNPTEHLIMEFRFRHKNGSYRWIYNKASSMKDKSGKVIRMFGAHTDITARKMAETELENKKNELEVLNAQKDKFFSIIAHDLKSPFNSIMGFSELLVEQINDKDYEGIEKYAEIIIQSSNKAVNLLTNLLDWARSQTGRMVFAPEYFEIVDFILEIKMLMEEPAGQKGIEIVTELPHNIPVYADIQMIHTVLRNLISNAIKFTNPGGKITIRAIDENDHVAVQVSDTGVGIPNDKIPLLFRIDENYSTKGTGNETGTGLGLILCKEFMEKHGGTISVKSTEGMGSTFSITLPKKNI